MQKSALRGERCSWARKSLSWWRETTELIWRVFFELESFRLWAILESFEFPLNKLHLIFLFKLFCAETWCYGATHSGTKMTSFYKLCFLPPTRSVLVEKSFEQSPQVSNFWCHCAPLKTLLFHVRINIGKKTILQHSICFFPWNRFIIT